jgi:hypothetical protein
VHKRVGSAIFPSPRTIYMLLPAGRSIVLLGATVLAVENYVILAGIQYLMGTGMGMKFYLWVLSWTGICSTRPVAIPI